MNEAGAANCAPHPGRQYVMVSWDENGEVNSQPASYSTASGLPTTPHSSIRIRARIKSDCDQLLVSLLGIRAGSIHS